MSEIEHAMLSAMLFAILIGVLFRREVTICDIYENYVHGGLLLNVVISGLALFANTDITFRYAILITAASVGATEAGWWAMIGIDKMLGPRRDIEKERVPWSFSNDPVGCSIGVVAAIALFIAMTMYPGSKE